MSIGKIGWNTVWLFTRMAVSALLGLATVRIVLNALGPVDYGVFSAVTGVVLFLSFADECLYLTGYRFLSRETVRTSDGSPATTFSAFCGLTVGICVLQASVGETIGTWFVRTHLNLPAENVDAAVLTCHLYVVLRVFQTLKAPFDARIFGFERMRFLCLVSVAGSVLSLLAACGTLFVTEHRLETYVFALLVVAGVELSADVVYCRRQFGSARMWTQIRWDEVRRQLGFFGWSALNGLSNVMKYSGVNVLVCMLAGVSYSASWKVAFQVGDMANGLAGNFQQACFPKTMRLWMEEDGSEFRRFIRWAMVRSLVLSSVLVFPLLVFADPLLRLWLGSDLPPQAVAFSRCMCVHFLFDAASNPLTAAIVATGRIARYQICILTITGGSILLAAGVLVAGFPPWTAVAAVVLADMVGLSYRVSYLCRRMGFAVRELVLPAKAGIGGF